MSLETCFEPDCDMCPPLREREMQQQDAAVAEDRKLRGELDVALMRFNAQCELRGFPKWVLMPEKERN